MVFIKKDNPAYAYILEARKYDPIQKEEQIKLFKEYEKTQNIRIKNKLINSNLMWVIKRANKYAQNEHHVADLINEGNMGLIEAFDNFDTTKDMSFTSFSSWYIDLYLKAYLQTENDIYIPVHQVRLIKSINKIKKEFKSKNKNTDLTLIVNEYNKRTGENIDPNFYNTVVSMSNKLTSLDDSLDDENGSATVANTVVRKNNIDSTIDNEHMSNSLTTIMNKHLSPREIIVVSYRFGLNNHEQMELRQIADVLNLTRERVGQILKAAVKVLQKHSKELSNSF